MLRSRLRMLLEALDTELASEFGESYVLRGKLTIEHLLPQQWRAKWSLPEGATAEMVATRDQLLHTLGNLTLVSDKLNPLLSNGPWPEKVAYIRLHSNLNLNRELSNRWADHWGESRIRERGNALFDIAADLWPR